MTLTVDRLLANRGLGLSVVGGPAGVHRTIRWAHVIELVDPTPWLTGGELVMTTGIWLPEEAENRREYVRRLHAKDTAALIFATGTVHSVVPEEICLEGDALGFPVIAVAAQLPFIAIGRAVGDALIADDIAAAKKVADQQHRLARAALIGGSQAVIEALARALGADVVMLDAQGAVLASAGRNWSDEKTRALIERAQTRRRRPRSGAHVDASGYIISQSLGVTGVGRGSMLVATAEALHARHRLLVSHAVTLISIELEKPAAVRTVERRLRAGLLRALLGGALNDGLGLLRHFGFTPEMEVIALVIVDVGPLLPAEEVLDQILAETGAPHLSMVAKDLLVVLLPAEVGKALSEHVYANLRQGIKRPISAGVGSPVALGEAVKTQRQALAAARNARIEGRRFVRFEELGTYSLLLGGQGRETLSAVASSALGPLERYDAMHKGELVRSLEVYLAHNGQWEAAAATLGVHRHTMRNRMGKVAELLGRDIDSAHVRAELWLAVKAHELLQLDA